MTRPRSGGRDGGRSGDRGRAGGGGGGGGRSGGGGRPGGGGRSGGGGRDERGGFSGRGGPPGGRDDRRGPGPRRPGGGPSAGPGGGPRSERPARPERGERGPAPRRRDDARPAAPHRPAASPPPAKSRAPEKRKEERRPADDGRPSVFARAHGGDWEAYEEILAQTVAPTFDAAVHLFADSATAAAAAEEALFALVLAVRKAEFTAGDPLKLTARQLVRSARAAHRTPFAEGLLPEDLTLLALDPTDGRGPAFGRLPEPARLALVLDVALDLEPRDLAFALEAPEASVAAALDEAKVAVPAHEPREAFRDVLDARASRFRLPFGLEDRVLDRLEATP